jgi:branched-chain amino acid transport system permease protein
MNRGNRFLPPMLVVATIVLLALLPHLVDGRYALTLLNQLGIGIVFALSYNMLLGQSGLLSFGHAVYFGLGGFAALHALNAITGGDLPLPVPFLPIVGGLMGLTCGIILGWVSTRRSGTIFAMISLGFAELVAASSNIIRGYFGGEEGISGDRMSGPVVFDLTMGPQRDVYYVIAAWMVGSALLMYLITQTPLGRMANAVRDNPQRVAFVGYNPQTVRFLMFALSGFFAGIAGSLFAINFEIITAQAVGIEYSASVLMMAYIGGTGYFLGPVLGAIIYTALSIVLSAYTEAWMFYLGVFFIIVVLYAPNGVSGVLAVHEPVLRARLMHRLLPAYGLALVTAVTLLVGAVVVIESSYHLSQPGALTATMTLGGIEYDADSWQPWVFGLGALGAGAFLLKETIRSVGNAWSDVRNRMLGDAAA